MESKHLLVTVSDVAYPDGKVGACYVLVRMFAEGAPCGVAVSLRRAAELQGEGMRYDGTVRLAVSAFDPFFGPDFPMVGEPRTALQETLLGKDCPRQVSSC